MVGNHYNTWNLEHKTGSERDSLFSRYFTASHPPREDWGVSPLMGMIPRWNPLPNTLRLKVVNYYNTHIEAAKTEGKFSASLDIQKWVEEMTAPPKYVWQESRSIEMAPFEIRRELYTPDSLQAIVTANWTTTTPLTGISTSLTGRTSTIDHDQEEDGD